MAEGDAPEDRPVWALGLMSGTSMDGVDAAALLTDGVGVLGFGPKRFLAFPDALRAELAAAQGLWQDDRARLPGIEAQLAGLYAEAVRFFPTTEIVGMHGQTLAHEPACFRTHQAGDGAALARDGGKPVVWDFRAADVLSGGEGAPLAPFFHHALARMLGLDAITAFLNIGGVANVTWIDPAAARPERPGALVAFDTGPGNAPIDDLVAARGQGSFDRDGALAAGGQVDEAVVAEVLADPYLARPAPKSLDRNHFAWLQDRVAGLATADAAATLAAVTAATIAASVRHMPEPPARWLVCGGGRHNAALMGMIAARTNAEVAPVEAEALDGDFLEAQAFAYLAVRVARGLPTSAPSTTGARLPVSGGRISRP
ncbi:anhydro-N-acetylmuramic acid kinase [Rhodobacteraceae bacterium 2CG4]|uniref:Anhydro-N-acetylmuramic acid kinase n=1 Tax=Halovulum marinum TaxID=2662447 RepID=A0A6L5Z1M2_9RHOB|nr:anhydro-N-acetylmuramic acid kinase [Halovulum marinum]MSU89970.1 anhydro-N-acetylmuramic acid kinase [Halovulum marinum]